MQQRHRQQQQLATIRAAQVAEVQEQRQLQRQAKLREIQEMDAAVEAAYEAEVKERKQHRAAQQRQWALYRQQQLEAEAVKRAAEQTAAREIAQERAELAAAEAEAAAAAAERAAAARAKLEAFQAEAAAAVEAKRAAAAAAQERERKYVEECKQVRGGASRRCRHCHSCTTAVRTACKQPVWGICHALPGRQYSGTTNRALPSWPLVLGSHGRQSGDRMCMLATAAQGRSVGGARGAEHASNTTFSIPVWAQHSAFVALGLVAGQCGGRHKQPIRYYLDVVRLNSC